ncbi:response regulator [Pedobacter rhodius]|uniref:Response regulator transcription factor n=1 Tax=Pedobacter rhodius TaxID=3004098 RepID=A0ABT4L0X6_9SPHI|nr:response regulator transcription factor [Pedobacter sp. SJ11]MCZ4224817.1 response regulator transcription factor [Pedobacter sp. SJ11]
MEKKKIFIVEDDLMLMETIQDILSYHGYECQGCYDPQDALKMIESFGPDLILLDYILPEWNGGELCALIRGLDGYDYVPIIITSAYANILLSVADYGCDAVLEKPFTMKELLDLIRSLLKEKRSDSGLMPKIKSVIKNIMPQSTGFGQPAT